MRFATRMLAIAVTATFCAASLAASTHTIKLLDGRILRGQMVRANTGTVWFRVAGDTAVAHFALSEVISLHFSSATVQPVAKAKEPVTVPGGTSIRVALESELGTKASRAGDVFYALLAEDLAVGDVVVVPRGKRATCRVRKVVLPKREGARAVIELVLAALPIQGQTIGVVTDHCGVESDGSGTFRATGGARPTNRTLATLMDGRHIRFPPGTEIEFHLAQPLIARDLDR
ncbi:MAG: hypothetical protein OEO21_04500 [Candidatus Krumholzibacteria bacterium]|nr:hypothetical protein [Candidatus Krumholzibacteria bacterium]